MVRSSKRRRIQDIDVVNNGSDESENSFDEIFKAGKDLAEVVVNNNVEEVMGKGNRWETFESEESCDKESGFKTQVGEDSCSETQSTEYEESNSEEEADLEELAELLEVELEAATSPASPDEPGQPDEDSDTEALLAELLELEAAVPRTSPNKRSAAEGDSSTEEEDSNTEAQLAELKELEAAVSPASATRIAAADVAIASATKRAAADVAIATTYSSLERSSDPDDREVERAGSVVSNPEADDLPDPEYLQQAIGPPEPPADPAAGAAATQEDRERLFEALATAKTGRVEKGEAPARVEVAAAGLTLSLRYPGSVRSYFATQGERAAWEELQGTDDTARQLRRAGWDAEHRAGGREAPFARVTRGGRRW